MSAIPVAGPARGVAARAAGPRLALWGRATRLVALTCLRLIPAALAAVLLRLAGRRQAAVRHLSRRAVVLLQDLGPVFVKAGQILGARRDVLPATLCEELGVLRDRVAPMSGAQARSTFADIYGAGAGALFRQIDYRPAASGSIACVYRAVLRDGREVAVKLQRPNVEVVVMRDLAVMAAVVRTLARLPVLREVPIEGIFADLAGAIRGQLDFVREAAALERLRESLEGVPRVLVPRLERDLCRDRAVVMQYIPDLGARATDGIPLATARRFARSALTAVYEMLFVDGFVHCDLHGGNLYFTVGGQVVILDAGFSIELSDRLRRLFAEFFLNMSLGRGRQCADIVVDSASAVRPDADLAAFRRGLAELVERNARVPAKGFSLIAFSTEMFDLQRRHGLMAATELVFPLLSLLVVEGTIRALDPDVDFQEVARPVLTRGLFANRATY